MQLFRIAIRNVVRNRRRSAITLLAIAMAVAVLIFVRGTLNGLQTVLKDKVIYGQTGVVQVHKRGYIDNVKKSPLQFGFEVTPALLDKILAVSGVEAAAPRIVFPTMVNANDTTLFSLALGIDPIREYEVCPAKKRELLGAPVAMVGDEAHSVVAPEIKRQLGISDSEELTLMAPDFDGTLNGALVKATGVLADNPAFSPDKKILFIPLAAAQALLRLDGQATEIAIKSADPDSADELAQRLRAALGDEFEVHTWRQLARFVVEALAGQNAALGFVIAIFAVVAVFGILNTMLMIVLSRTKEIGTMMALGVRRRAILSLIVFEAGVLGGLGAIFGVLLGLGAVALAHAIGIPVTPPGAALAEQVRPFIGAAFVARAFVVAVVGASLAALYPALRASKLTPIKALAAL